MAEFYPAGPQEVPADLTCPSAAYKRRAWVAMASLALFVTLYLALAGWFVWTAYRILGEMVAGGYNDPFNILAGGSAAFLALFMLKALFFVRRGGAPDDVEITAEQQPRLFEFLYRLADEAGAPRPRRVFLSARVNAAVFYDFSVLNLLLPSHKNLEIGLALVNVLNISELKAVLAHEFGHFAQRSMAIGSWVYIAQQIASHIVKRRDALDKFIGAISRIDVRVAWIGWLLSLAVWSIRSLMDTLLTLVVLAQRALSRQMEFQADRVAVSLTGSDELINALHKLQAADDAWARTESFANAEIGQGRVPHDLFAVQSRIIEKLARIFDDETYGKAVPNDGDEAASHRVFKKSFAQPPQMWSTHPANADREENAKRHYLPAARDERSGWLLFDDVETIKKQVTERFLGEVKAEPASEEQTFSALDDRYTHRRYESRYRGAYLGRALARNAPFSSELYEAPLRHADLRAALAALYSPELGEDLGRLRELEEEKSALEALRDKVYQATGGKIVYRGRELSRRDLPAAIQEVTDEAEEVRKRVLAHDRECRAAHLAVADQLGHGWREYLIGLIDLLHYAEHTQADLLDASGLLGNVVAVVTADGKVSSRELKRLLATANMLHDVLTRVYRQGDSLSLDAALRERLGVAGWADMVPKFELGAADKGNIGDWLNVVDGWVNAAAGALSAIASAALDQLLATEDELAGHLREGTTPADAPAPSRIPDRYPTLLPGQERKRQRRLGLWDRFQTADGPVPAIARLIVAGVIVNAVLGFGNFAGSTAAVSIYNGLGTEVRVSMGGEQITIPSFSAVEIPVTLEKAGFIETRSSDGARVIERFKPNLEHARHYVYNVAGASPLVEWTAVYGTAHKQPPRFLGTPRWLTSSANVFFTEPPQSVKTSGGGATRMVLSGLGDEKPDQVLKLLKSEQERRQVILSHATWDRENAPNTAAWRALAKAL